MHHTDSGAGGPPASHGQDAHANTTPRGTPRAKCWSDDWIATVDAKESLYGRRICGARLMSGTPCTLTSNHPSGRCRFHGGFDLTGAPEGNRNAVIHGLYSRRLMPCGPHCPVWQSCPLAFSLGKEKGPAGRYGEEKPLTSEAGRNNAPTGTVEGVARHPLMSPAGKWEGVPADNPNIQHHSWGFGGLARPKISDADVQQGGPSSTLAETHGPTPPGVGAGFQPAQGDAGISRAGQRPAPTEDSEGPLQPTDYAAEILRLPLHERPICPYEQTAYNTAVTDALQRVSPERTSAYGRHIAHMLALAQVMVSRAGLALREAQFTETLEVRSDNYNMTTTKVTAALTAYEKLERAWRRLLADFERNHNPWGNYEADAIYEQRIQSDYDLNPDAEENLSAGEADTQGAVAAPTSHSRESGNDKEESETGGPSSTLAAADASPAPDSGRAAIDTTPSCHSLESGNLKKSSQSSPDKPANPD